MNILNLEKSGQNGWNEEFKQRKETSNKENGYYRTEKFDT